MIRLRHDMAGDSASFYNDLVERGAVYGHQCKIAEIGNGTILDVVLTKDAVLILYEKAL